MFDEKKTISADDCCFNDVNGCENQGLGGQLLHGRGRSQDM